MEHPEKTAVAGQQRTPRHLGGEANACDTAKVPARDKRFDECSIEEKIERIRWELIRARDTARSASSVAAEAHRLAHDHVHAPSGQVFKPAQERMNFAMEASGRSHDPLA